MNDTPEPPSPDILDLLQDEDLYLPREYELLDALQVWSGFGSAPSEEGLGDFNFPGTSLQGRMFDPDSTTTAA